MLSSKVTLVDLDVDEGLGSPLRIMARQLGDIEKILIAVGKNQILTFLTLEKQMLKLMIRGLF